MHLLFGNKVGAFAQHEKKRFFMTKLFLPFGKMKSLFLLQPSIGLNNV